MERSIVFLLVVLMVGCCSHQSYGDDPKGWSLVQLNMVYRHGERNPVGEYPTSQFYNEYNWDGGFGQLTLNGMQQLFSYGKWIMSHYGPEGCGLLPAEYNAADYNMVSTDADRTIMSAMANSAGIYTPPKNKEIANGIQWTPVPVRSIPPNEYDQIFSQFCPELSENVKREMFHRFQELQAQNPAIFQYVKNYSGLDTVADPTRIILLRDAAVAEKSQKFYIPEWLEKIFPQPLNDYFKEFLTAYTATAKSTRLSAGPTLKAIIDNMLKRSSGMDTAKLYAYSAHDVNVFSILRALGLEPKDPPDFSSAVIFELHEDEKGAYYVKLFYRPGPSSTPEIRVIPGCEGLIFCPLKTFISVTQKLLSADLREDCLLKPPETTEQKIRRSTRDISVRQSDEYGIILEKMIQLT